MGSLCRTGHLKPGWPGWPFPVLHRVCRNKHEFQFFIEFSHSKAQTRPSPHRPHLFFDPCAASKLPVHRSGPRGPGFSEAPVLCEWLEAEIGLRQVRGGRWPWGGRVVKTRIGVKGHQLSYTHRVFWVHLLSAHVTRVPGKEQPLSRCPQNMVKAQIPQTSLMWICQQTFLHLLQSCRKSGGQPTYVFPWPWPKPTNPVESPSAGGSGENASQYSSAQPALSRGGGRRWATLGDPWAQMKTMGRRGGVRIIWHVFLQFWGLQAWWKAGFSNPCKAPEMFYKSSKKFPVQEGTIIRPSGQPCQLHDP